MTVVWVWNRIEVKRPGKRQRARMRPVTWRLERKGCV